MDEQLDSVDFQLQELNEAMKLAEANPARFRIDHEVRVGWCQTRPSCSRPGHRAGAGLAVCLAHGRRSARANHTSRGPRAEQRSSAAQCSRY
eukprot:scaffold992_cov387-Prasinococcus_capsulatus_cf.AAC.7